MNVMQLPTLKLELSHMKQTLLVALADYQGDVSKQVEAEIETAIENFNFSAVVQPIIQKAIADAVEEYFAYGKGRKQINDALEEVFSPDLGG